MGGGRGKKTGEWEDREQGETCEGCRVPSVETGADPPLAMRERARRQSQKQSRRLCPVLLWTGE